MYNAKGEILGAVDPKTGKIYLNKEKLNPNTLIHESGHIWAEWADANAKDLMDAGLEKVRNSPYIKEVLSKDFYLKEALKYGEKGSEGYNRYFDINDRIGFCRHFNVNCVVNKFRFKHN